MNSTLQCPQCGREDFFRRNDFFCPACRQPMWFKPLSVQALEPREKVSSSLEKFLAFLPLRQAKPELSLGEGQTPLIPLNSVSSSGRVWAKLESINPSLSFKDRGSAVVVQKAAELGWPAIGTVSTGNMASSTAAYAARAGLSCVLLVKKGTSPGALISATIFKPLVIEVDGDYGELFRKSYELGREFNIYFANSVDPLRLEGYKLTALEILEQLGQTPNYVYVPLSSGGHFLGLYKGFLELKMARYIDTIPVMVGVQAASCAPIVRALEQGLEKVVKIKPGETIAHSIANPDPPAGDLVLKVAREKQARLLAVSDQEMLEAQNQLASQEGLFVQPESAAVLAAFKKLPESSSGPTVLILTGQGLKAAYQPGPDRANYYQTRVEELPDLLSTFFRPTTRK
ncbi:MAG: threonine synthase [Candidatus Saccharicenans sp.]|uniref:threonine synthase n=1 Tax=Candidatus Saccharicenans sp. TaxID=2819258 RepID=UPI00404B200C